MRLILTFHAFENPQLSEIVFLKQGQTERIAVRGKSSYRGDPTGRFQWTSAVKAFAILGLGARLGLSRTPQQNYTIVGEEASAAASLDYAISKPTQWVLDVFGEDRKGKSFASRAFQRQNSERKRPGPVKIRLSSNILSLNNLVICVGDTEIESEQQLSELLNDVSEQFAKNGDAAVGDLLVHGEFTLLDNAPEEFNHNFKSSQWFKQVVRDDLRRSLRDTSLIEKLGLQESVAALSKILHPGEREYLRGLHSELERSLPKQAIKYRPLSKESLAAAHFSSLSVKCSPFATGVISLLMHIRDCLSIPIEIDWSFPGTSSILENLEESHSSHDAFVLSWGAALKLRASGFLKNYRACALLPRTSFSLVLPSIDSKEKVVEIFLSRGKQGYPEQYFTYLSKELSLSKNNYSLRDATISECITHLKRGSGGAVLASPLSDIMQIVDGCKILGGDLYGAKIGDNILFLNEHIEDSRIKLLIHAITQSWFRLLQDTKEQERIVQSLVTETPYCEIIKQLGGLYLDKHFS